MIICVRVFSFRRHEAGVRRPVTAVCSFFVPYSSVVVDKVVPIPLVVCIQRCMGLNEAEGSSFRPCVRNAKSSILVQSWVDKWAAYRLSMILTSMTLNAADEL